MPLWPDPADYPIRTDITDVMDQGPNTHAELENGQSRTVNALVRRVQDMESDIIPDFADLAAANAAIPAAEREQGQLILIRRSEGKAWQPGLYVWQQGGGNPSWERIFWINGSGDLAIDPKYNRDVKIDSGNKGTFTVNSENITISKAGGVYADSQVRSGGNPINNEPGSVIRAVGQIAARQTNDASVAVSRFIRGRGTSSSNSSNRTLVQLESATQGTQGTIKMKDGGGVSYNTTSDARLKTVVGELTGALSRIRALRPVSFFFTADDERNMHHGLVAQEVREVGIPQVVEGDEDAFDEDGRPVYLTVDLSAIVPDLIAAVTELSEQLDLALGRIEALEGS